MMLIAESEFWEVYFSNTLYLELNWKPSASSMSEAEFKSHLRNWVKLLKEHHIHYFLVDTTKGHIIMDEEIQAWHDEEIVAAYKEIPIHKIAFLQPTDFFTEVSLYMTFEEKNGKELNTRYFAHKNEAMEWLLSEEKVRS